jgi:superfamily I DNA and RNA helicase
MAELVRLPNRRSSAAVSAVSSANQVSTAGRLLFDSVHRFKGQQAAAVVLVDVDPDPASLELEQRRLFCGMTRATVKLDLLVRASNPFNARVLEAGVEPGRYWRLR